MESKADRLRERLAFYEQRHEEALANAAVASRVAAALAEELAALYGAAPPDKAQEPSQPGFALEPVQAPAHKGETARNGHGVHASPGEMGEAVRAALKALGGHGSGWATTTQVARYVAAHRPPSLARRRIPLESWKRRVLAALDALVQEGAVEQQTGQVLRRRGGRAEASWRLKR